MPRARGPLSQRVFECLRDAPAAGSAQRLAGGPVGHDDPITGADSALTLYVLYELHYRGFADVDDGWEWDPALLAVRRRLERAFMRRLRERVPAGSADPDEVLPGLAALVSEGSSAPSLSQVLERSGTIEQMREFAIHRSAYQLKEADPHSWAIPRLRGRAKAAMVEIQADEYGGGVAGRMHSELFAATLRSLGLSDDYGEYLDRIPGVTLATVNLMSLFGLHRRWRGALVGHLAYFEMTSVLPMARYANALRRLGCGDGAEFYDVHVAADAHHEVIARCDLADGLARDEPALAADIVFGARALHALEYAFAAHVLRSWNVGRSSLLM